MNTIARLFSISVFLAIAGCGGGAEEDVASNDGAIRDGARDAEELTLENWEKSPKLREVFDLRTETEVAIREQLWKIETKGEICDGPGEESRTKGTDRGVIRVLALRGGSDDSFSTLRTIYDAQGKLRSVESSFRTVHATGEDHEVFFDAGGQTIWEVIREWTPGADGLASPGPWRLPLPVAEDEFDRFAFDDHNFVDHPARVFDAAPRCH